MTVCKDADMRRTACRFGCVFMLLAVATGCTTPAGQPFITMQPYTGFRAVAPPQPSKSEEDNPFARTGSRSTSKSGADVAADDDVGKSKKKPEVDPDVDRRIAAFDASTRQLIEQELQDAAPAEREELLNDLQDVEPGMVRQVLKIRRMMTDSVAKIEAGRAKIDEVGFEERGPEQSSEPAGSGVVAVAAPPDNAWADPGTPAQQAPQSDGQAPPAAVDRYGHSVPSGPVTAIRAQNHQSMPLDQYAAATPTYAPQPQQPPQSQYYAPAAHVTHHAISTLGQTAPAPAQPTATPAGPSTAPMHAPQPQIGVQLGSPTPVNYGAPAFSQTASLTAGPNTAASVPAAPLPHPGATMTEQQPGSAFGSAMGTINSAYSAVISNLPGRDSLQSVGSNLSNSVAGIGNRLGTPEPALLPNAAAPFDWHHELQRMTDYAAADAAQTQPGATPPQQQLYIEKQVQLRLLYLLAGQQERALAAIPGIHPADQEFWQQVFWSLANYFDDEAMPDSADRATQTVTQLRTAIERLQENARLEIRNVNFCHKISSYGSYERFQRDEFTPGQPVLVYAEVENFKSEPMGDGQYRTLLRSTVEIYRAGSDGGLVQSIPFQPTEDLCRNHRRDYFHSYEFTIPQRVSLGPHVMKLTVEDQLSRKVATYSLNFTVK
jgi:hypothetical protein